MHQKAEYLTREAYHQAKGGKIYEAQKILGLLYIYNVSPEDVTELRKGVGLTYLKWSYNNVHFGLVQYFDFRISTIYKGMQDSSAFIGLSPYANETFGVEAPVYKKDGDSHEVLFKLDRMWLYGNFTQVGGDDHFYCGRVINATGGRLQVIPYFNSAYVKALALGAIKGLRNADSHVWAVPEDFNLVPTDYKAIQQEQTRLALSFYKL